MASRYNHLVTGWARPDEILKSAGDDSEVSLWGTSGRPQPGGIQQGSLGDCWFLASASSLAENPERVEKLFSSQEVSKEGIYQVTFQAHNGPVKITVDDRIPVREIPKGYVGAGTKNPFNSKVGANKGWWLPILEKAYAKFNSFYANLNGGLPEQALREMSGMPTIRYNSNSQSESELFAIVNTADKKHWVMTASCYN